MPGPDLSDPAIEADDTRERLRPGQGNLCIGVMPGDERLGDLSISIQYEGPKGAYEECMERQNHLLEHSAAWLHDILGEISPESTEWEVDIDSLPCPKAKTKVHIEAASEVLRGIERDIKADVEREEDVQHNTSVRQDVEHHAK